MVGHLDAKRARLVARVGGLFYLAIIVIGALGEGLIRGRIVVAGKPTATAANLVSLEWLWRLGVAGEMVLLVLASALSLILYLLLRPVNRDVALMAVFFNLVCIAVEAVAGVSLATALLPVTSAEYATAFGPEQLGAMATLAIRSHTYGFGVGLIFFGVECVVLGWLIARSGYMPRTVGRLMQLAGVCYVINSAALLLSPALSNRLFPAILLPAVVAEFSLAIWLLARGVRAEEWNQAVLGGDPGSRVGHASGA